MSTWSWLSPQGKSPLEQLGKLREQAASVLRDKAAPAVSETAAAVAGPVRRAVPLLVQLASDYSGPLAELLGSLRAKTLRAGQAVASPRSRTVRAWLPGPRTLMVGGLVLAAGVAAYGLAVSRRPRRSGRA